MSNPCLLEFAVPDEERFARLVAIIEELKRDKKNGALGPGPKWNSLFEQRALAHFWWPTPAERDEWLRRWKATPVPERWNDPSLILAGTLADATGQALVHRSTTSELTVQDVAERLQVSTATVYGLCRRRELEYHRVSNSIRVPEDALAAYLAAETTRPSTSAARDAPRS